jgi:hypothetical protein
MVASVSQLLKKLDKRVLDSKQLRTKMNDPSPYIVRQRQHRLTDLKYLSPGRAAGDAHDHLVEMACNSSGKTAVSQIVLSGDKPIGNSRQCGHYDND